MICVFAACGLAIRAAAERAKAALSFIGVNSIVFYVVHMPLIALIVRGAKDAGVTSFYLVAGGSLLCAALVPLALIWLRKRAPAVGWLFSFPDLRAGRAGQAKVATP